MFKQQRTKETFILIIGFNLQKNPTSGYIYLITPNLIFIMDKNNNDSSRSSSNSNSSNSNN